MKCRVLLSQNHDFYNERMLAVMGNIKINFSFYKNLPQSCENARGYITLEFEFAHRCVPSANVISARRPLGTTSWQKSLLLSAETSCSTVFPLTVKEPLARQFTYALSMFTSAVSQPGMILRITSLFTSAVWFMANS